MGAEFAEQHAAGRGQLSGHHTVRSRNVMESQFGVAGGTNAGGVVNILDGIGNAVQRAEVFADGKFRVRAGSIGQSAVGGEGDERVHLRINLGDAVERGLGEGEGGRGASAQLLAGVQDGKFGHAVSPGSSMRNTFDHSALWSRPWPRSNSNWARKSR